MLHSSPYIQGNNKPSIINRPLERFLPPISDGTITRWLNLNLQDTDTTRGWLVDPFGASPTQTVELARDGWRVLVTANNPITRFLFEIYCRAPNEKELKAALAALATASKGSERIEAHIRSLYMSECNRCDQQVMVSAFLWERDSKVPYAAIYACPHCKLEEGEYPVNERDRQRASRFHANDLHHLRALERIAPLNTPNREHVEEAVNTYLPRALYAIFTLINKVDGLSLPNEQRDLLHALLLSACDFGCSLWAHPSGRERPLQLSNPPRFRENNIWLVLEDAVASWASDDEPVPVTAWPDWESLPEEGGGICIFDGRLRLLAAQLGLIDINAVAAAMPRPNQAFWTLCALWSGWLWGHEAIGPFASVLQRRRYDWGWHTTALGAALLSLAEILPVQTPFYGLISPLESSFLAAALIAADHSGFDLISLAISTVHQPAQLIWQRGEELDEPSRTHEYRHRIGMEGASRYLNTLSEPADYLHMSAAALAEMSQRHCFRSGAEELPGTGSLGSYPNLSTYFSEVQDALQDVLSYRGGFLRYNASETVTSGLWWLRDHTMDIAPMADRIEIEIVNMLLLGEKYSWPQVIEYLNQVFPGLLTPDPEFVQLCLESYAVCDKNQRWQMNPNDDPSKRRSELVTATDQLRELGKRLGFEVFEPSPLRWIQPGDGEKYYFYLKASSVLGNILLSKEIPLAQSIVVLPGSRANLVTHKLNRDPRFSWAAQQGCRFLKFRHLRALYERPAGLLTQENIDQQLVEDPLTLSAPQMRLF